MKKASFFICALFLLIPAMTLAVGGSTMSVQKPSDIKSTSATANGNITALVGGNATVRGFAYGTLPNLSGGDTATTTENGSFTAGLYAASLTGLTFNTTYYIRAYETNPSGTAYSGIIPFKTASSIPKPANNLGLLGYWPMDEATSTQAGDFSGNGNAATLTTNGGVNPAWTNGKLGQALFFDGSGGYTNAGNSSIYNFTSGSFSVAFWIKSSGMGDGDSLITRSTDPNGWYIVTSNALELDTCQAGPTCQVTLGTKRLDDGTWHHAVATRSGSTVKLYVDGIEETYGAQGTHVDPVTTTANLYFGTDSTTGNHPPMTMDDVRIYNRALSATEAANLYNTSAARFGASSKTLTLGTTLTNSLAGLWTFDGGDVRWTSTTAGVAYDGSGNNNNGTLTSMSRTNTPVIGKLGQALTFDGNNEVTTADINATDGISKLSVAFWAKPTSLPSDFFSYVSKYNNTDGWSVYSDGGSGLSGTNKGINFTRNGTAGTEGGTSAAGGIVSIGTWTHVVVVFDETLSPPNCLKIYANGISQAITYIDDGTGMCAGVTTSNASFVTLAGEPVLGLDPNFTGALDDVRIYTRALSDAEVLQLYRLGAAVIMK